MDTKKCDYCEYKKTLVGTYGYMTIDRDGSAKVLSNDSIVYFNFKYCPLCGKKL